ncbi:MAG TPA: hypothetical protein VL084_10610 [Thermoanaerobaculia bacterium]|nr:hypothetical protein [Thermoanaerobaculia bacterium]
MTENRTPFPKLAVFAVAGLIVGYLLAGLLKPSAPVQPSENERSKERIATIQLVQDPSGQITGILDPVSDDQQSQGREIALSRNGGHYAHWVTNPPWVDVTLEIGIKKDSENPFSGPFEKHGRHLFSAKVRPDAALGSQYKYWVKVHDNKTGMDWPLDPIIRVVP